MSDWTRKTSVSSASKDCCQREAGAPVPETSTSSGVTWTRLPPGPFSQRTVAVRRYLTRSSRAIARGSFAVFRYGTELPRAITSRPGSEVSFPRTSSAIPSAK